MESENQPFLNKIDSDIELNDFESKISLLGNTKETLKHLSKLDLFYLTIALAGVQFTCIYSYKFINKIIFY